jgi:hypothetical protein
MIAIKNIEKGKSIDFKEIHLHELKLFAFIRIHKISKDMLYDNFNRYKIYNDILYGDITDDLNNTKLIE